MSKDDPYVATGQRKREKIDWLGPMESTVTGRTVLENGTQIGFKAPKSDGRSAMNGGVGKKPKHSYSP